VTTEPGLPATVLFPAESTAIASIVWGPAAYTPVFSQSTLYGLLESVPIRFPSTLNSTRSTPILSNT